jgi:ABC-type transport system involved in multi-copper enzyme maturation permease subunit
LLLLCAQIPFALVAVTMGGIGANQIFAGFICLLSFTFLVANVGLLCSVIFRRSAMAAAWAFVLLFLFVSGPGFLAWTQRLLGNRHRWLGDRRFDEFVDLWDSLTPFTRLSTIFSTHFVGGIVDVQAIGSLVGGVACFLLAWAAFDAFARRATDSVEAGASGRSRLRRRRRSAGLGFRALVWKEFHALGGWWSILAKVTVCAVCAAWLRSFFKAMPWAATLHYYAMPLIFGSLGFLALCLAWDASRIFQSERQQRTLASLCALPLTATQIAWAKTVGSLLTNWPPALITLFGLSLLLRFEEWGLNSISSEWLVGAGFIAYASFCYLQLPLWIAWLSLRYRRGALSLGIVTFVIGHWIVMFSVASLDSEELASFVLPAITGTLLVVLARSIPRQLEACAAEE